MKGMRMEADSARPWIIRWMYMVVIGHLLTGIALPWIGGFPMLDAYHRSVESGFWNHGAPSEARAQQIWWISLFGPTVQSLAIWMGALTRIGDRHRSSFAWAWLIIGVMVWAPQDMLVSLRAGVWIHVWVDCFALFTMLPPLIWLWLHDRKSPQ
jgi:hypothetical protein